MEGRRSCTYTSGNECNCVYLQCATLLEGLINSLPPPSLSARRLSLFHFHFSVSTLWFCVYLSRTFLSLPPPPPPPFLSPSPPLFHPHSIRSFSCLFVRLLTISLCSSTFTCLALSLFLFLYLLYSFFLSFSRFHQYTLCFFLSPSLFHVLSLAVSEVFIDVP